jgi:hypothetical protein
MTDNNELTVERPGDPRGNAEKRVEYATATSGGGSPFPSDWGWPEGREGSDERRAWILSHVNGEQRMRELRERDGALQVVRDRAALEERR